MVLRFLRKTPPSRPLEGGFGDVFLSVGAMKAGTTWLFRMLSMHPELHFAPEKELHYFHARFVDPASLSVGNRMRVVKRHINMLNEEHPNLNPIRDRVDWAARFLADPVDDVWFSSLFPPERAGYVCDFSNLNAHVPAAAWQKIAANCRRLRVIYTLRHPVDRMWSHVKFHLRFTGDMDKLDSWGLKDFERFIRQPFIRDNAEYGAILRRLRDGLAEDQLKLLLFDDIQARPQELLQEIEQFLGVAHHSFAASNLSRKFNFSPRHPMPEFFPDMMARHTERVLSEVAALGFDVPEAWHSYAASPTSADLSPSQTGR